jgi:hypothetical protein
VAKTELEIALLSRKMKQIELLPKVKVFLEAISVWKLTTMSTKEGNNGKKSREPYYDDDKDQLKKEQEELITNQVF